MEAGSVSGTLEHSGVGQSYGFKSYGPGTVRVHFIADLNPYPIPVVYTPTPDAKVAKINLIDAVEFPSSRVTGQLVSIGSSRPLPRGTLVDVGPGLGFSFYPDPDSSSLSK